MVPPSSHRIPRVRWYSGSCHPFCRFTYRTLTFFGWLSHAILLQLPVIHSVLTPSVFLPKVWPLPLSLATTRGISFDFSSSPYLDVSVRGVPHIMLFIHIMFHGSSPCVFPHSEIRGYSRLFAAHRGLSQLVTSFFGS